MEPPPQTDPQLHTFFDPFREFPFRRLGHGYPMAEALKHCATDEAVNFAYGMGTLYFFTHALWHSYASYKDGDSLVAFFDTLVFDGFASDILPSFVVYHMCRLTANCVTENGYVPSASPFFVGLIMLEMVWKPIDKFVDSVMDATIRNAY
ncbi:uncharacterized protein LOC131951907 [Physella acuta]|uniref:uncharacterized protein LOC131951907 n=1 Tax=Physella acuta TaxID=109671 RepID=UPI0027DBBC77|nr:uncharacterized protein LOC131951907 [Physella acuta]